MKRHGCNMLKRKPILRSEATPPKFFIPEQKGKVVYKAPGDPGATPAPLPPNIFKKDISPATSPLTLHQIKCILCSFGFSEQQRGRAFD